MIITNKWNILMRRMNRRLPIQVIKVSNFNQTVFNCINISLSCRKTKLASKRLDQVRGGSQLATLRTTVLIWVNHVSFYEKLFAHYRHKLLTCVDCAAPGELRLPVGWRNMLNPALWSRQARMNNTTGCRGGSAVAEHKRLKRGKNALV